jgi:hypothetical protein
MSSSNRNDRIAYARKAGKHHDPAIARAAGVPHVETPAAHLNRLADALRIGIQTVNRCVTRKHVPESIELRVRKWCAENGTPPQLAFMDEGRGA